MGFRVSATRTCCLVDVKWNLFSLISTLKTRAERQGTNYRKMLEASYTK